MKEHEFTLYVTPGGENMTVDAIIEALAEAGCTDALLGLGVSGRIGLQFIREAESAGVALTSAIKDVKKALPNAEIIEVFPNIEDLR